MRPVRDEALRHVLLGIASRADHTEDEGDDGDDGQGQRPLEQAALPLAARPSLGARCPGGPLLRRWNLPSSTP
jgi:hypothetical protein